MRLIATMLLQGTYQREAGSPRVEAFHAPMKWIELTDRYPAPGEHVMVKMDDGIVEIGYWDTAKAGWSHSPFERWGMPVAWAVIPPPTKLK
jgi:hypothetical protein